MTDENGYQEGGSSYVLFVWSPSGWTLQEREGQPPGVGATIENGDTLLRVSKIGPSPLPGDRRRCAFTQLA
jgi:hypothetical protein